MDRRKTALSDHICGLFRDAWSDSFVGVVPDFEELNDTWEILAARGCMCDRGTSDRVPGRPFRSSEASNGNCHVTGGRAMMRSSRRRTPWPRWRRTMRVET